MAQRSKAGFKSNVTAQFPTNGVGSIGASRIRTHIGEDVADSFLNRIDDFLDEDDMASDSPTAVPSQQSVVAYLKPLASTGTAIAFDRTRTYGYTTAETGNITINTTGLKEGVTQLVIHNYSSIPTFGAECKVISGEYATGVANYIFLHSVSSSLVLVTISQEI